jgi:hypothetical protein
MQQTWEPIDIKLVNEKDSYLEQSPTRNSLNDSKPPRGSPGKQPRQKQMGSPAKSNAFKEDPEIGEGMGDNTFELH